VSLRSRTCSKCGAPQDITVRHRQELDANIGRIVREWVLGFLVKEERALPAYELYSAMIDHVARVRRMLAQSQRKTPLQAPHGGVVFVDAHPDRHSDAVQRRIFEHLMDFVREQVSMTRIDFMLVEIERALRDERYDVEHERVMANAEVSR
jgi:hypothetical protein